jgi:hypothetical protein
VISIESIKNVVSVEGGNSLLAMLLFMISKNSYFRRYLVDDQDKVISASPQIHDLQVLVSPF